jgi:hypothetical protein
MPQCTLTQHNNKKQIEQRQGVGLAGKQGARGVREGLGA